MRYGPVTVPSGGDPSPLARRGHMMAKNGWWWGWAVVAALAVLLGAVGARAQQSPPTAEADATSTQTEAKGSPPTTENAPSNPEAALEPRAIEILKASSRRLAAARTMS